MFFELQQTLKQETAFDLSFFSHYNSAKMVNWHTLG